MFLLPFKERGRDQGKSSQPSSRNQSAGSSRGSIRLSQSPLGVVSQSHRLPTNNSGLGSQQYTTDVTNFIVGKGKNSVNKPIVSGRSDIVSESSFDVENVDVNYSSSPITSRINPKIRSLSAGATTARSRQSHDLKNNVSPRDIRNLSMINNSTVVNNIPNNKTKQEVNNNNNVDQFDDYESISSVGGYSEIYKQHILQNSILKISGDNDNFSVAINEDDAGQYSTKSHHRLNDHGAMQPPPLPHQQQIVSQNDYTHQPTPSLTSQPPQQPVQKRSASAIPVRRNSTGASTPAPPPPPYPSHSTRSTTPNVVMKSQAIKSLSNVQQVCKVIIVLSNTFDSANFLFF